ncbi:MAG TPA: hypothetical protein IAB56_00430 [Candidatus Scybalousia intestinigallinarum]|nr:hypothetical protein [Candidatus Scybalousia intestinigallinarum]
MGQNLGLSVEAVTQHSQRLFSKSEELDQALKDVLQKLESLMENGVTYKDKQSSKDFYEQINVFSTSCNKYVEGVQKFASFLVNETIATYETSDQEILELQSKLDESLAALELASKLGDGNITSSQLDFSKISATAGSAALGSFIAEDKVHKQYWEGELQLVPREDGTIQIVKDGTVMGYTTEEGVNLPDATDEAVATFTEEMNADLENGTAGEASVGTSDTDVTTSSISNGNENYPSQVDLETAKNWSPEQIYTYMENGGTIYDSQTGNTLDSSMMDKNAALFNDFTDIENTSSNSTSVSAGDGTTIEPVGTTIDPDTGRYDVDMDNLSSNHETIPFPENARLVRPGVQFNFENNNNKFDSLVYNSDTNRYDLMKKDGTAFYSFDVDDVKNFYFEAK